MYKTSYNINIYLLNIINYNFINIQKEYNKSSISQKIHEKTEYFYFVLRCVFYTEFQELRYLSIILFLKRIEHWIKMAIT